MLDGCIHRFSDSRTTIGDAEVVLINSFTHDAPIDSCIDEQYPLYLEPTWTQEKQDVWYGCVEANLASPGVWGMQARREDTGASVTGSGQTYVWGWSDAILPGGEIAYLVESLPAQVRFDLADVPASQLQVLALPADGCGALAACSRSPGARRSRASRHAAPSGSARTRRSPS